MVGSVDPRKTDDVVSELASSFARFFGKDVEASSDAFFANGEGKGGLPDSEAAGTTG